MYDEDPWACYGCGGHGCQLCHGTGNSQQEFANEGSALRAASRLNPRNLPCPTCKQPNKLTPKDKKLGYQCDACADRDEGLGGY